MTPVSYEFLRSGLKRLRQLLLVVYLTGAVIRAETVAAEPPLESAPGAVTPEWLNPRAKFHIPIGIPNTVDTLKTFIEAEGCFSPGFATFGVYCWVRDSLGLLHAPTQSASHCTHGLAAGGLLIPWSSWQAGPVTVHSEVCQVEKSSPAGAVQVVALRVELSNTTAEAHRISLFLAIRPLGPAGWPIKTISVDGRDTLLVDGHTALVADRPSQALGVTGSDTAGAAAVAGRVPDGIVANSPDGNGSGALQFDIDLPAHGRTTVGAFCPVLAGRRAVGHRWDPSGHDNFRETAVFNPAEGGSLQPDPGAAWCRSLRTQELFDEATAYWRGLTARVRLSLPDRRWSEAFAAIAGHIAMNLNEDAPDVAVINYTTFNRDGMYNTEVLQQSGLFDWAAQAIDYLYAHPFNGRPYPEADNPGQILWVTAQHWRYTRDKAWLKRILPNVRKLAALVRYCRTTPTPHWVDMQGLEFGEALPVQRRKELQPGRCDGSNFNYTEAYDIAGLRAAAVLCAAAGESQEATTWSAFAEQLLNDYDKKFGSKLGHGYGSYCVLWPCRLYPLDQGPAHDQFCSIGAQKYGGWPYFPPATAHQGLLAGNREAGHGTLAAHLDHPQMQGWYAFDEGPFSGVGGWEAPLRTRWKKTAAMPHGWAIAEVTLLLRDSLALEDGDRLLLLAGVPDAWLTHQDGLTVERLPTHFGDLSFTYRVAGDRGTLQLTGTAQPPGGFVLRLPKSGNPAIFADGKDIPLTSRGDASLPAGTQRVTLDFRRP